MLLSLWSPLSSQRCPVRYLPLLSLHLCRNETPGSTCVSILGGKRLAASGKSSSRPRECMVCAKRNTWVGLVRCEPALDNHKDEPASGWGGGGAGVPVRRGPALGPHPLWYQALCSFCRPSQSSHGALWRLDDRVVLITRICFLVMVTHLSSQPIGQGEGQNHNHFRITGFQT